MIRFLLLTKGGIPDANTKRRCLKNKDRLLCPLPFGPLYTRNHQLLIAKHSLNFLGDVDEGMFLTVGGYWNKRHQFVVQKYTVYGKTKIMLDIDAYRQKTVKAGSL